MMYKKTIASSFEVLFICFLRETEENAKIYSEFEPDTSGRKIYIKNPSGSK
jgi:hypothetical protein